MFLILYAGKICFFLSEPLLPSTTKEPYALVTIKAMSITLLCFYQIYLLPRNPIEM